MNKKVLIRIGAAGALLGLGGWAISSMFKGGGKVAATPSGGTVSKGGAVSHPTNSGQAATVTTYPGPSLPAAPAASSNPLSAIGSAFGSAISSVTSAVTGTPSDVSAAASDPTGDTAAYQVQQAATQGAVEGGIMGLFSALPVVGPIAQAAVSGLGGSNVVSQGADAVVQDVTQAVDAVTGTMAPDNSTADETATNTPSDTESTGFLGIGVASG